jgi:PAS domain S-box-containing protein
LTDKESKLKEVRLKVGEGIAGWVAKERKVRIVNDIKEESYWARKTDDKIDFRTKSVLAVPLVYKDKLLGVVEAVNKKAGPFLQEDADVLSAFAAQSAVSIENARLFENLREEKEKIEAVFSQMSDGAVFYDENGRKLLYNNSAQKLLGHENIIKETVFDMFSDFDKDESLALAIAAKDKFVELEMQRTKGKTLYLSCVISRIFDSNNKIIGSILIFRDTTSDKKENLLKANFLSLVSHKLKTPLVSIIGYGPLLLSEKALSDFQRKAIESIYRQGVHLSNLVDKLLYYSLIEGEKLSLVKGKKHFNDIIERALANLRPNFETISVELKIDDAIKNLPMIDMDSEKIEVALRNILENAVKFNTNENKKVEVAAMEQDGLAGLVVKDNGPGIPPEIIDKIFDAFFTTKSTGSGLGLAICAQMIRNHNGRLEAMSGTGEGATFVLTLPSSEKSLDS